MDEVGEGASITGFAGRRPRIVQHSFGQPGSGGPIGVLRRILRSSLADEFQLSEVWQPAAGGINLRLLRRMARQISAARPDLVHVRGLGNEGFHGVLASRMARAPRVLVSVHGSQRDLVHSGGVPARRWLVSAVLEPLTLRMADSVVVVAHAATAKPVLRPVRDKVIGVVPNGVDVPEHPVGRGFRTEIGASDDDIVVTAVGRLVVDKGQRDLIAAAAQIRPVAGALHLVLVGEGPDRYAIEDAAGRAPCAVHVLGLRHDVSDVLAGSDIFCLPSYHENLSVALLEAMAFGLPVVATAVGGNVEVLADGGGVLVTPGRVAELVAALQSYVKDADLRARTGARARAVVEDRYSSERMFERLGEVYAQMLGRS